MTHMYPHNSYMFHSVSTFIDFCTCLFVFCPCFHTPRSASLRGCETFLHTLNQNDPCDKNRVATVRSYRYTAKISCPYHLQSIEFVYNTQHACLIQLTATRKVLYCSILLNTKNSQIHAHERSLEKVYNSLISVQINTNLNNPKHITDQNHQKHIVEP